MRLIDADKYLKETCTYKDTGCGSCIFQGKCIADEPTVFEFPDNPTNGDMIKAIFPDAIYQEGFLYQIVNGKQYVFLSVTEHWWNAPYKKELEE